MSRYKKNDNNQFYMPRTPNWLVRWGISILSIILFGILVFASFFPYPIIIKGEIVIGQSNDTLFNTYIPNSEENYVAVLRLKPKQLNGLEVGQKAVIQLENYPFIEYGSLIGRVSNVSKIFSVNNTRFSYIEVPFNELTTSLEQQIYFEGKLYGQVEITIESDFLLNRLLNNAME